MKKHLFLTVFVLSSYLLTAQSRFPKNQISINAFRNPSIGLEYHRNQVSVHAGYYLTNFTSGVTTEFAKVGVSYWFLPWGKQEVPSSLYAGTSYLRGLTREYKQENAAALEIGARFTIYKGLNFRLGAIALYADGKDVKINPNPSLSYSIKF